MADSSAFFLSLWSFQAGRVLSAKVVVFRAASSLSLHCRHHTALQGDGWLLKQAAQAVLLLEQWVRSELAVVMVLQHWQALAAGTGELHDKFFGDVWLDCDCPIWGHLTAQKYLAKLMCWKSHREQILTIFKIFVYSLVSEILSFKNNSQKKFSYRPIFGSCIGVLTKRRCLSQGL